MDMQGRGMTVQSQEAGPVLGSGRTAQADQPHGRAGPEQCPTVGGALNSDVGAAGAADGGAAELHRHLDRVAGAVNRDHLHVSGTVPSQAMPCYFWSSRVVTSVLPVINKCIYGNCVTSFLTRARPGMHIAEGHLEQVGCADKGRRRRDDVRLPHIRLRMCKHIASVVVSGLMLGYLHCCPVC